MKNRGFTMIELMITIAIASMLIAIATPSFSAMVLSNSVNRDRDALFTLLLTARTESINRGRRVSVCKSADLMACSSSNSVSWTDGWIVFFDANGNGTIDTGDTVLKINEALETNISLAFSGGDYVAFNSLGRPGAGTGSFTFTHSSGNADYTRTITLSATGRVRKG